MDGGLEAPPSRHLILFGPKTSPTLHNAPTLHASSSSISTSEESLKKDSSFTYKRLLLGHYTALLSLRPSLWLTEKGRAACPVCLLAANTTPPSQPSNAISVVPAFPAHIVKFVSRPPSTHRNCPRRWRPPKKKRPWSAPTNNKQPAITNRATAQIAHLPRPAAADCRRCLSPSLSIAWLALEACTAPSPAAPGRASFPSPSTATSTTALCTATWPAASGCASGSSLPPSSPSASSLSCFSRPSLSSAARGTWPGRAGCPPTWAVCRGTRPSCRSSVLFYPSTRCTSTATG